MDHSRGDQNSYQTTCRSKFFGLDMSHFIPYGRQDISQEDIDTVVEVLKNQIGLPKAPISLISKKYFVIMWM